MTAREVSQKSKFSQVVAHRESNHLNFSITQPQDIPSNGQEISVHLREWDLPAYFQYVAYPAREEQAFLFAYVPDWRKHDLLSGEVALSMGGQYLGTTRIDARSMKDSLEIPMGRDQQILIRRETIRNEQSKSIFGGNINEERSFAIHLKNEKESAISMEVIDQIPVSSNPDIIVKVIDLNGGQLQQANGKVSWTVRLEPGRIWFSFSYRCGILKIRSSIFHDGILIIDPCHEALNGNLLQEAGHELIDEYAIGKRDRLQYPGGRYAGSGADRFYTGFLGEFSRSVLHCSSGLDGNTSMRMGRRYVLHRPSARLRQQAGGCRNTPWGHCSVCSVRSHKPINRCGKASGSGRPTVGKNFRKDCGGIIGYGRMGSAFSQLLVGFDLRILVYDKYKADSVMTGLEKSRLSKSNRDRMCLPSTFRSIKKTRHYIDRDFITKLKQRPYLINTSRGDQVGARGSFVGPSGKKSCAEPVWMYWKWNRKTLKICSSKKRTKVFWTFIDRRDVVLSPHIAGWTHQSKQRWLMFFKRSRRWSMCCTRQRSPLPLLLTRNYF